MPCLRALRRAFASGELASLTDASTSPLIPARPSRGAHRMHPKQLACLLVFERPDNRLRDVTHSHVVHLPFPRSRRGVRRAAGGDTCGHEQPARRGRVNLALRRQRPRGRPGAPPREHGGGAAERLPSALGAERSRARGCAGANGCTGADGCASTLRGRARAASLPGGAAGATSDRRHASR